MIGDVPNVAASNEKAKAILGWKPEKRIEETIMSAYKAHHKMHIGNQAD